MREIILHIKDGGLGDQLFYTPIPRLVKEKYPNASVFICNVKNLRSANMQEFIWRDNPYICGFTKNTGKFFYPIEKESSGLTILNAVAGSYGFNQKKILEPEIYSEISINKEFEDSILIDLNYKSFVGVLDVTKILDFLSFFSSEKIILINPPYWLDNFFIKKNIVGNLSLHEYAEYIKSCKLFITYTSGGATLAAALKRKSICLYGFGQKKTFHHSAYHYYKYVGSRNYFVFIYLKFLNFLNRTFLDN